MTIKTALLVDDSKIARLTLRKLLEEADVRVDLATSGQEVLNQLQGSQHPNVVFVDHLMPGMSGEDVALAIKKNPATARIPVIMCCSKITNSLRETARNIGVYCLLRKPPQGDEVDSVLNRLSHDIEQGKLATNTAESRIEQNELSNVDTTANDHAPLNDNEQPSREADVNGNAIVNLTIDTIEKAARASIETNINTRVHELLSDLFDEQYSLLKRLADESQGELESNINGVKALLDQKTRLLKEQLLTELALTLQQQVSQQFKALKKELEGSKLAAVFNSEQLEELKDHITSVQSIDTEFWQTLQAETIQQAHDASREAAEDIARHTIRLYAHSRRSVDIKVYLVLAGLSIAGIVFSFAYFSGAFG